MKKYILFSLAGLVALSALGQTTPPNKLRSNDSFTQVDNYLVAAKRLGIPSGPTPTLNASVSPENSTKLFYDTDDKTLMVYDPVSTAWSSVSIDLTNYYTKSQVDSAIAANGYTFTNGLTNTSGTVRLGGNLTGTTTIQNSGGDRQLTLRPTGTISPFFTITGTSGFTGNVDFNSNINTTIESAVATFMGPVDIGRRSGFSGVGSSIRFLYDAASTGYAPSSTYAVLARWGDHVSLRSANPIGSSTGWAQLNTKALTTARVYDFPDRSGILALVDDITLQNAASGTNNFTNRPIQFVQGGADSVSGLDLSKAGLVITSNRIGSGPSAQTYPVIGAVRTGAYTNYIEFRPITAGSFPRKYVKTNFEMVGPPAIYSTAYVPLQQMNDSLDNKLGINSAGFGLSYDNNKLNVGKLDNTTIPGINIRSLKFDNLNQAFVLGGSVTGDTTSMLILPGTIALTSKGYLSGIFDQTGFFMIDQDAGTPAATRIQSSRSNGTRFSRIETSTGTSGVPTIQLQTTDATGGQSITMDNNGITVTDQNLGRGITYAGDYSANYTDRSLVDKAYVGKMFSYTTSGDGVTTSFSVPHGLTYTPTMVMVTPNSADVLRTARLSGTANGVFAAYGFYATVDATNVNIIYPTGTGGIPPAGTDNLTWTIWVK